MKHSLLSAAAGLLSLACVGSIALQPQKATAEPEGLFLRGASYLTTITDATGAFASRGVLTLHADYTVSVIDSGQGGPAFFFSSQLGSWKPDDEGGAIARTIDFDFPPNADVARLDYTIKFAQEGKQVSGTITLTVFPLQGNPLGGGGTVGRGSLTSPVPWCAPERRVAAFLGGAPVIIDLILIGGSCLVLVLIAPSSKRTLDPGAAGGFRLMPDYNPRAALILRCQGVLEFATANARDFTGFGFKRVWYPLGQQVLEPELCLMR